MRSVAGFGRRIVHLRLRADCLSARLGGLEEALFGPVQTSRSEAGDVKPQGQKLLRISVLGIKTPWVLMKLTTTFPLEHVTSNVGAQHKNRTRAHEIDTVGRQGRGRQNRGAAGSLVVHRMHGDQQPTLRESGSHC